MDLSSWRSNSAGDPRAILSQEAATVLGSTCLQAHGWMLSLTSKRRGVSAVLGPFGRRLTDNNIEMRYLSVCIIF